MTLNLLSINKPLIQARLHGPYRSLLWTGLRSLAFVACVLGMTHALAEPTRAAHGTRPENKSYQVLSFNIEPHFPTLPAKKVRQWLALLGFKEGRQVGHTCSKSGHSLHLNFGIIAKSNSSPPDLLPKNPQDKESYQIQLRKIGGCPSLEIQAMEEQGLVYGAYDVLQELGVQFHLPLKPELRTDSPRVEQLLRSFELNPIKVEKPYWPVRALHLHTQHPIELTKLLNGWGQAGPEDEQSWNEMLSLWDQYLEWMTAHRQNEVEWVLLWDDRFLSFNQGTVRQKRLRKLTAMAKDWNIRVGIDAPIAFSQQKAWTLLRSFNAGNSPEVKANQKIEIQRNLDWLVDSGFQFISGELGKGEFESTPSEQTLEWLNSFAEHLRAKNVIARFKVHVSHGQWIKDRVDPVTGMKPLNFNFLPFYADSWIGLMPHTIQIYSLEDPAPTYNRSSESFDDIYRFLIKAAQQKNREVLFYPEASYWVSYDIDVPLGLPVYAYRRVHDLHRIAIEERCGELAKTQSRIQGQMLFSSGWAWGYWLNEILAARAAWNPHPELENSRLVLEKLLNEVFQLGENERQGATSKDLSQTIANLSYDQHELLVLRNGIAYLSAMEAWDELGSRLRSFGNVPLTQPDRLHFWTTDVRDRNEIIKSVRPLLDEIVRRTKTSTEKLDWQIDNQYPLHSLASVRDLRRALKMTELRAEHVLSLYSESRVGIRDRLKAAEILAQSNHLDIFSDPNIRQGMTAWESPENLNPTSYRFGYLWSADSLFYWWREFYQTQSSNGGALCFMNIMRLSELTPQNPWIKKAEWFLLNLPRWTLGWVDFASSCARIPNRPPDAKLGESGGWVNEAAN